MSQLHKSNRYYLTDMFPIPLDTLLIFIIDNIDFDKDISDIYPIKLHLNKANIVDKETFLIDWPLYSLVQTFPKALHSD